MTSQPLPRQLSLDVIRGFAILGIVLLNVYAFAWPPEFSFSLLSFDRQPGWLALAHYQLDNSLLRGRFMTLLSLLFGVSLYLLAQRCPAMLQRRLAWLMLIGAAHGLFWWFGDILLCYGLTGWLLLRFGCLQWPPAKLWRRAHWMFGGSMLLPALYVAACFWQPELFRDTLVSAADLTALRQFWTGDYGPILQEQAQMLLSSSLMYPLGSGWSTAALMLYGMALYQSGWFSRGFSTPTTAMLFALSLGLSALTGFAHHKTGYQFSVLGGNPLDMLAMLLMALSYASVLIRLSQHRGFAAILSYWLACCGRLAFSLYLLQSLLLGLLFRHIRPDWFAALDAMQLTSIALVAVGLQLLLCQTYLRFFRQGPFEWLWRRLSNSAHQASQPQA